MVREGSGAVSRGPLIVLGHLLEAPECIFGLPGASSEVPWSSFWCSLGGPSGNLCRSQTVSKIFKIHYFLHYFEQRGLPKSYLEGHRNSFGRRSDA